MLTARDRDILQVLVWKTRIMSAEQAAKGWWGRTDTACANARRRLRELRSLGLVDHVRGLSHPELPLERPVWSWQPGDAAPDPWKVSYQLQRRWTEAPRQTTAVVASRKAVHMFGAAGRRLKQALQVNHDLHVTGVYLRVRELNPEVSSWWVGEDALPRRRGLKVPDAVIVTPDRRWALVIDFGGAYPASRVERFHRYWEAQETAYQLW